MTLDEITQILGSDLVADMIDFGSQGIAHCQHNAANCITRSQYYLSNAAAHLALAAHISHLQRISKLTQDLESHLPSEDSP